MPDCPIAPLRANERRRSQQSEKHESTNTRISEPCGLHLENLRAARRRTTGVQPVRPVNRAIAPSLVLFAFHATRNGTFGAFEIPYAPVCIDAFTVPGENQFTTHIHVIDVPRSMMTTLLGSARRACTGPTRRETLKVGRLSVLGGLFHTPALQAFEESGGRYLHPSRAKSVVLMYLQGGAPTQDMFDLKPHGPGRHPRRIQAHCHLGSRDRDRRAAAPNRALDAPAAIVRSVYHNGGCHKNLPMYTGFDVNLPDEEFRDSDPPSMGSVCAYVERDTAARTAGVCLSPVPAGLGGSPQESGTARRISWDAVTIRSPPSARRTSTTLPTTSGIRRSCAASRTWPT